VWAEGVDTVEKLKPKMDRLKAGALQALEDQGFRESDILFEEYLNMRYRGTESALMVIKPEQDAKDSGDWAFGKAFVEQHMYEFGFTLDDRDIIVDDVRVRAIGKSYRKPEETVDEQLAALQRRPVDEANVHGRQEVYFEQGRMDTPVYKLDSLTVGDEIKGPAMVADGTQTIVIPPKATAAVLKTHVVIDAERSSPADE
jgi:5-oxoprolinase (ATP-hydrolysing)